MTYRFHFSLDTGWAQLSERRLLAGARLVHGLEHAGADLAPSDKEQWADSVERGLAVVRGDEGFRNVQRQRYHAGYLELHY